MKILHTSDWHLGKKLGEFSRHNEQVEVLGEICIIADYEQVDIILIAGDIFDTFSPPVESIELFYKTVKRLSNKGKRPVIAIAGNHDSPDRMEAPDALALEDAIILSGNPDTNIRTFKNESGVEITHASEGFIELKIPAFSYPIRFLINPYANAFRLKKFLGTENAEQELRQVLEVKWKELANLYLDKNGVNIFCGHFFFMEENGTAPEEPEDGKPLYIGNAQAIFNTNLPGQVQYAALGHLHRKQVISNFPCPVVYCGSPLAYSFSESFQTKYVCIIDLEPGESAVIKDIALIKGRQLARERFKNMDMAIDWLSKNKEKIVEITLESDEFLSAADRKKLYNAHDFIINIIPDIRNAEKNQTAGLQIDMSKNIKELFVDYFKSKNQQEPDKELLKLFNEVLSHEENMD